MSLLLNGIYALLLFLLSPWLIYRTVFTGRYREGFAAKFWGQVPLRQGDRPCVWLHAVSVGEVNLVATLVKELSRRRPEWQCVVSTTTAAGYTLAQKRFPRQAVFYCPLDWSWATRRAMRRVRPAILVLAELELWPNLVRAARAQGAKVAVVNARLSQRSFKGYQRIRPLVRRLLAQINLIAVQNGEYADRFLALGADESRVHITGSMKFDGAEMDHRNPATLRLAALAGFQPDDVVFLAGSTQEPEEAAAIQAFQSLKNAHPRLRLVIVPRHPHRFDGVAKLLTDSGLRWQRRTELDVVGADPQARVLLVDAVGELGAWWGTARIAFVGGSLGNRGGQNMIEPAAYGAAVSFGPSTRNFRDVVAAMLRANAACEVQGAAGLTAFVRRCLEEPQFADALGRRAQALVRNQLGATARTVDLIDLLMPIAPCEQSVRRVA
ncbi:MAG: 3-deoxy-D-manno-octulosonic acid transferase [Planctomycetes bacterium]|nr:3-deoxy-D-manno-octulosonic acid transferase [Planctomycetota bacterium]